MYLKIANYNVVFVDSKIVGAKVRNAIFRNYYKLSKKYQTLEIIQNEAILREKKIVAYQQRAHVCYDDRKVSSNQWPELKPPKPRKSMPRQPSANSCFAWFQRLWQTVGRMASFLASNAKPRIVGKNWEAAIRETLYVSPLLPSELKTDFHGISLYQPHGTKKKSLFFMSS